jgi:hypothetical protein
MHVLIIQLLWSMLHGHFDELVFVSQVQVMNVTSQGNSTLIRWGIFPAGPDNAMSNTTAMVYNLFLQL